MLKILFLQTVLVRLCASILVDAKWPESAEIGLIANDYPEFYYKLASDQALLNLKNASIVPNDFQFKYNLAKHHVCYLQYSNCIYFSLRYQQGCDDSSTLRAALKLWGVYNCSIIIGPSCESGKLFCYTV